MNTILDSVRQLFQSPEPVQPGTYHYQSPPESDRQVRYHLRVDQDGKGLIILNASTVLHLNQTAVEYAYHLVQGTPAKEVARRISARYKTSPAQARKDYLKFQHQINLMLDLPDLDPVAYFGLDREQPYSGAQTAPYRLDCALTYRLPETSSPDLAPTRRVDRELDSAEWKTALDKAWEAGIPQIIFTGGEPTLREDLPDLIAHAENNGQVTGLLSGSPRLKEQDYLDKLLLTGLDHLMFILSPQHKESWEVLSFILKEDLFTTAHITLKPDLIPYLPRFVNTLADLNANAVSFSISEPDNQALVKSLEEARTLAAEKGLNLKWDLPVPYSRHNPVALEIEQERDQSGSGKAWLYVEPDGDVLPAQGVNRVLGNLLRDDWQSIWSSRQDQPAEG
ncbi:MAG: hypothetical protein U5K99_07155 [Anaerolineales bacterium]|nr:hypothetical protein [Anaerolineales bacterium]